MQRRFRRLPLNPMLDIHQNHFELFDLPASFAIDLDQLDRHYRKLQSEVHPDKFAAASPAERLRSMQLATHVNEAYQTLKSPITRARYLLHLHGVDTLEETNTAMPATSTYWSSCCASCATKAPRSSRTCTPPSTSNRISPRRPKPCASCAFLIKCASKSNRQSKRWNNESQKHMDGINRIYRIKT
jgi:curved DNA-binding protein CbpA